MPRPSNTGVRRAQVAQALLAVMSREGYERASISKIAKQAKLAPGLVHYHFESKLEILVTVVQEITAAVEGRYAKRIGSAHTPIARLHALIDAHLSLDDEADPRAVAAWNVIGAEAVRQGEVRRLYSKALAISYARTRSAVVECLEADAAPTRHASQIASSIVCAIEGCFRVAVANADIIPRGSAAAMVKRMADSLLSPEREV
ncbi:MAG: TetR family transcriptional regulator C-terminal domain-containing protein [Sandaracinaceae bacterium]|nr:TetR family transcriptional regulator C-terminal domain-containing protein [Sandaracinaceae bacterium]